MTEPEEVKARRRRRTIAFLDAENVDWKTRVLSFARKKTGSIAIMRFDDEVKS
jgi:hypothetical protein